MRIQQNKIDDLNAQLEVTIEKGDYELKVNEALKDYRKKVQLKGFRQGMVPMGMVKKMIGNQVLVEEINKILQEEIDGYIREKELDLLGYPLPNYTDDIRFDIHAPTDYKLSYDLGLAPKVDLKYLDKSPKFKLQLIKVEDKTIDEEVENMRKRHGKSSQVEKITEDDYLHVELTELGKDGLPLEEGVKNSTSLPINMIQSKSVKKAVMAAKRDDVIQVDDIFKLTDKDENELANYILGIQPDLLKDVSKNFEMKILNISHIEPAELNEEFFKKIYPDGSITDLEGMKNKIKEDLTSYFYSQSERKLINDMAESILDNVQIPLPEDFLKRWIKSSNEKEISDAELEDEFPKFVRNLRWSLILKKVAADNDLKVEMEDIKGKFEEMTKQQMAQYGLFDIEQQQLDAYVYQMMQNREQLDKVRENLLEEKVLDVIRDKVSIQEKNVSLEQFNKSLN